MANANPSTKYHVDKNIHKDRSPIRKADGMVTIKKRCEICDGKYGYNEIDGDSGCPDCEARMAMRQIKADKLKKLEEEVLRIEKENAEYEAKEAELKARLQKAKKGKK
jgi:hypothetical protein